MAPQWSQEDAIAFESARECITDLIAILVEQLEAEASKPSPRADLVDVLSGSIDALAAERRDLRLENKEAVQRIRQDYGAQIRRHREAARKTSCNIA